MNDHKSIFDAFSFATGMRKPKPAEAKDTITHEDLKALAKQSLFKYPTGVNILPEASGGTAAKETDLGPAPLVDKGPFVGGVISGARINADQLIVDGSISAGRIIVDGSIITDGSIGSGQLISNHKFLDDAIRLLCGTAAKSYELAEATGALASAMDTYKDTMMAKTQLTQKEKQHLEDAAARIVALGKKHDLIFEVEGAPNVTYKTDAGEYRRKEIYGGWEFFFDSAYVGARGQAIFCLEGTEKRDINMIEVDTKKMDDVFPLAAPALARLLGYPTEKFVDVIDLLLVEIRKEEADAEMRAAEEEAAAASNNKVWGAF